MSSASSSKLEGVLSHLRGVKRNGPGFVACCPAHGDKTQSLSVREVDGKILFNCFAGCEFKAIVEAIGLAASDMFPEDRPTSLQKVTERPARTSVTLDELAASKKLPAAFLRDLGWSDGRGIHGSHVEIPYTRRDGSLQRMRIRTALTAKEGSRWGQGDAMIAYEPDHGALAAQEKYAFVVEGETDVATLLNAGFPAIGIPGSSATKVLDAEHVAELERVFIVEEPDPAGLKFAVDVQARLRELSFQGAVHVFKCPDTAKDPCALWQRDQAAFPVKMATAMLACKHRDSKELVEWRGGIEIFAPLPPVAWCVKGLQISPGRPTILAGYGASAKTLSAQSMALCFAAGLPVWGAFDSPGGQVRHLDYEQGWYATARRYQRLAVGHGINPRLVAERLKIAVFPSISLDMPGAVEAYSKAVDGAQLVVIDALRGATPGVDENDSRIRSCIDTLTRVSEKTGAAFVLIHHAGKPKDSHSDARMVLRGSAAIFDGGGAIYVLAQGDTKDAPRKVIQAKPPAEAEGMGVDDFALRVEDVEYQGNPAGGVRVFHESIVKPSEAELAIAAADGREALLLEIIRARPGQSKSAICASVKLAKATTLELITGLCARGLVTVTRSGQQDLVHPLTTNRSRSYDGQ